MKVSRVGAPTAYFQWRLILGQHDFVINHQDSLEICTSPTLKGWFRVQIGAVLHWSNSCDTGTAFSHSQVIHRLSTDFRAGLIKINRKYIEDKRYDFYHENCSLEHNSAIISSLYAASAETSKIYAFTIMSDKLV